jgi:hypothetical protein
MFHFLNITTTDIDIIYKVIIPSLSTVVTLIIVYALKPNDKIKYKFESFDRSIVLKIECTEILERLNEANSRSEQIIEIKNYIRYHEKIAIVINAKLFDKAILSTIIDDFALVVKRGLLKDMWKAALNDDFPEHEKTKYQRVVECYSGFWFKRAFFRLAWTLEDALRLRTIYSKIVAFPSKLFKKY